MTLTPKQQREANIHNRYAQDYYQDEDAATFQPDLITQRMLDLAGELQGKAVLECGCGRGLLTEFLARQGAIITAVDISDNMIDLAKNRLAKDSNTTFQVGALENLAFEPASFDLILGVDILHHLDLGAVLPRLHRWLKPQGKALFVENIGLNPILTWSRRWLAGRFGVAQYGTPDEHPLSRRDLHLMQKHFAAVDLDIPQMVFLHLFARNVLRYRYARWLHQLLDKGDEWLFRYFPTLRWLSYKAVVVLQ